MLRERTMEWMAHARVLTAGQMVYLSVVLVAGCVTLVGTLGWLRRSQSERHRWLFGRRQFDAVPTGSPLGDPNATAAKRARDSIDRHSQVTRRLLLPWILLLFVLLLVLPFLGNVPAVFVSLAVTAVAVVLGITIKPLMENAISGLVLSSSRLVRIGDTVELDGYYGTIEDISATHTTLKIWDWRRYVVPNSQMLQAKLLNYSLVDKFEWAHVEFHVAYGADLDQVERLAMEAAIQSSHFASYEAPKFWVMGTHEQSIRCWIAAWAETPSEAWGLKTDIRRALSDEFRKRGIWSHQLNWSSPKHDEMSAAQ